MRKVLMATGFAAAVMASPVSAATYGFSYIFDAFASVTGFFDGSVSSGILTVDDVVGEINSTGGSLGVTSYSFDTSLGGFHISGNFDTDPGTLALDGSFFDLAVIETPVSNVCLNGNGFCLIGTFASATVPGGNETYTVAPGSFSIFEVAAVPLPASLPLLGAGLAAFGFLRRRKKA